MHVILRWTLLCLLLAWLPGASVRAQPASHVQVPVVRSAEAFDAAFDRYAPFGPLSVESAEIAEQQAALQRLEALLPPADPIRAARLDGFRCRRGVDTTQQAAELTKAERGLAQAQQLGDVRAQAEFLLCRAYVEYFAKDNAQAARTAEQLLALTRQTPYWHMQVAALDRRIMASEDQNRHADALNDALQAIELLQRNGAHKQITKMEMSVGRNLGNIGLHERAEQSFRRVVEATRNDKLSATTHMSALLFLGYTLENTERLDQARDALEQARTFTHAQGFEDGEAYALLGLARIAARTGRYETAIPLWNAAQAQFQRLGMADMARGDLSLVEGLILSARADNRAALVPLRIARTSFHDAQQVRKELLAIGALATAHRVLGENEQALALREEEIALREQWLRTTREEQSQYFAAQFQVAQGEVERLRLQAQSQQQAMELAQAERVERNRLWLLLGLLSALVALLGYLLLTRGRLHRARIEAQTDGLTGARNRRGTLLRMEKLLRGWHQRQRVFCVVAIDVDHFKRINDTHGHAAGDRVLVWMSDMVRSRLRETDTLGRMGGEEFVVLLPGMRAPQAQALAERIRGAIAEVSLDDIAPQLHCTLSLGVAQAGEDRSAEALLARADAALYAAKRNGRNRVEMAADS